MVTTGPAQEPFRMPNVFPAEQEPTREGCANESSVVLLGVAFDGVTMSDTVQRIDRMVASRRSHYVVTANADFLAQARRDVELHRILLEADLVLCDGTPLVWASRWLGNPLPERVAGSDLAPLLIQLAAERGYRLFLLGASPEANAQAVERLKRSHPTLNIVGNHSPPFKPLLEMDHDEIKRRIRDAKPDLLFVSFGCPKQEKWIAMHYRPLGVPVCIGVGATIDFLAGRMKRAPRWMQQAGVEWIYRLLQEPRRLFRRYVADIVHFGAPILAQCWEMRWRPRGRRRDGRVAVTKLETDWQRVEVSGSLDAETVRRAADIWERISVNDRHCLLELSKVGSIDAAGIALLVRLQRRGRNPVRRLLLLAPGAAVQRVLKLLRLGAIFEIASDAAEAREMMAMCDDEQRTVLVNGAARPLAWRGEITAANADEVWQLMEKQVHSMSARAEDISIDLSELRFIDSSGLGVMLRTRKLAQRQRCRLSFTGLQPRVRNVVKLSKLEPVLFGEGR